MIKDNVQVKGQVQLILTGPDGKLKHKLVHNLVVDTGSAFIASRMKDATKAAMSHIAVGTGNAAPAKAQTALSNEIARAILTSTTIVTTNAPNDAIQYLATFAPGIGTGAIVEAAIFNASSVGEMLARTVFAVINKGALDTLTITWKVTVA
jgi:hypothetical protein